MLVCMEQEAGSIPGGEYGENGHVSFALSSFSRKKTDRKRLDSSTIQSNRQKGKAERHDAVGEEKCNQTDKTKQKGDPKPRHRNSEPPTKRRQVHTNPIIVHSSNKSKKDS